jgi:hypothetical protein
MPCQYGLTHDFIHPPFSIVRENNIFDRVDDRFSLEFLTLLGMLFLTLEFDKVLFPFEHPLELLDPEDRAKKRNTSRVMKHNPILQGALPPKCKEGSIIGET